MAARAIGFADLLAPLSAIPAVAGSASAMARLVRDAGFESWMVAAAASSEAPRGILVAADWPQDWISRYSAGRTRGLDGVFGSASRRGTSTWSPDAGSAAFAALGMPYGVVIWTVARNERDGVAVLASREPVRPEPGQVASLSTVCTVVIRSLLAGLDQYLDGPAQLTPQEVQVLRMISEGRTSEESAAALGLTPNTINSYVRDICAKLGAASRVQAVAEAIRMRIID